MIDFNNAYKYKLILTKQCNMNCVYCFHGKKYELNKNNEVSPEEMASYLPANKQYTVTFFGGEPLLNYDYLKKFAEKIREKNPLAKFNVVTNGLLLNEERVKTLNELDIRTTISHDTYSHSQTRGPDPLKKNGEIISKLKHLGFISTITSKNWNLFKIWDFFEDYRLYYKIKRPTVVYAGVRDMLHNIDESLFVYNHKEFEELFDKVCINLINDLKNRILDSYEVKAHMRFLKKVYYSSIYNMGMAPCYTKDSVITFDTNGNLYNCHNANLLYGNVRDISSANPDFLKIKEKCNFCNVREWCIKCPKVVESQEKYYCYFQKTILTKLMTAFEKLDLEDINNNDN